MRQRVDGTEAVWTSRLSARDGADYDELVDSRGHLLQSRAFAPIARAGRPRSVRWIVVRCCGRVVGAAQISWLGPVAWVERGPTAAPGCLSDTLAAVERAARRRGVVHLTVSPFVVGAEAGAAASVLATRGYRPALAYDGLHRVTGWLDVAQDPLEAPERAKLRRESRRALRHGARVTPAGDAALLARLTSRPAAWARAVTELAHTGAAAVLVGRDDSGPVAAALVAAHGRVATYVAGAAIDAPRPYGKLLLPLLAGIDWARARGCLRFDLGGLPAPGDTDAKRAAIARFKMDFAPTVVPLVGPHRRWLLP